MPFGTFWFAAPQFDSRIAPLAQYLTDGVGIARWLVRSLNPQAAKPGATLDPNDPLTWALLTEPGTGRVYERLTDFDGDARYQDYSVSQAGETLIADPTRRYFGAWGHVDLPNETRYSTFSNQVGSTELVTFADGAQAGRMRYTAFGEPLSATGGSALPRYGYAGAWGYEGGQASNSPGYVLDVAAEAGLLHVGARYYDPSVGRFLQRDPIGIRGGLNVYGYVNNSPTGLFDPTGHGFWDGNNWFHDWIAQNLWMGIHSTTTLSDMSNGRAYAEAWGGAIAGGLIALAIWELCAAGAAADALVHAGVAIGEGAISDGSGEIPLAPLDTDPEEPPWDPENGPPPWPDGRFGPWPPGRMPGPGPEHPPEWWRWN